MSPPRWPGEPTHDCPKCGRIVGPLHMRTEHLKHVGWEPYQVVSYLNWSAHAQEIIPFPLSDGGCQFVPVLGRRGSAPHWAYFSLRNGCSVSEGLAGERVRTRVCRP